MDSRKTLFLLVLVGLVGGFVVWDHYHGVPTAERESKGKRLLTLDAKAVTHVELVRSNQTILLDKTGDRWDIRQPLAVRADASAVSALLDELEFADRARTLTEKELAGTSLAEFGLAEPRATIKLQTKTGLTTLRLGNETPAQDALYVNVDNRRTVFVVRKTAFDRSHQTLDQLRSRTVLEFAPASATRLELKTPGRSIELTKSNLWVLARPLAARADQTKISELLADLENLRVADFVSEKPEDVHLYHLDEPEHEVTVTAGGVGKTLLLGKPLTNDAAKVYAKLKGADSIFTIAAGPAQKFAVQINDLRDPRVLPITAGDVTSIAIARGADKMALRRDDSGWKITGPVAVAGDDDAVRRFLNDLGNLRVKQFTADVATDLDKFGLTNPALTVTLTGAPDLLVGSLDASNGVRFVKRADEPFIYGIEAKAADIIPASYGVFRSRVIFDFKPEQITKLTVGEVTIHRGEQGQWKLIAPANGVLDVDAANAVAGVVAGLRADAFGRPKTEADHAQPVLKFTAAGAPHSLANAPDGQSAADTVELTFQLAGPVVETLTKKLVTEPKP
jgi:hypothetical protein